MTCNRYEEDQRKGSLVDTSRIAGTVKDYQEVIAVGSNSAGIKPGDTVVINPVRYSVMKHKPGSMKDGVIEDNPVIGYNLPILQVNGKDCMLIDTQDIDYVIEEYEEVSDTDLMTKAAEAGLYTPPHDIIGS